MCISNSGLSANSNRFLFNLSILQTESMCITSPLLLQETIVQHFTERLQKI